MWSVDQGMCVGRGGGYRGANNDVDKGVVKGVAGDVDVDRPHLRC